ncbi:MAG: hypothetical protein Q4G45_09020 [Actinomycetia bacterium]|nr:hypothetical protein [Actinomycetes bacterium]
MAVIRDSAWKDWYRSQHDRHCLDAGEAFERYVTELLKRYHDDFINPDPMGSAGDWGCDGLADGGQTAYACYGPDPVRGATTSGSTKDSRTASKIRSDFERAVGKWRFTTWCFVTSAPVGPEATQAIVDLQARHAPSTARPLTIRVWKAPDDLWDHIVVGLTEKQLNDVLPGVPHAQNVELGDIIDLIDRLMGQPGAVEDRLQPIRPVLPTKMDFNQIAPPNRAEFAEGRIQAARIDGWFDTQSDPGFRDAVAHRFRELYERVKATTTEPSEVVERLYTAVGGEDFRYDQRKANAVYAVVAYFFDSCDIFEEPSLGGETSAAAD